MANEQEKPLFERTLTALLLVQLNDLKPDVAADILIRAGWTNPEVAEILGITANAVALRRFRTKRGKPAGKKKGAIKNG
jgi:hypothetical protein